MLPDWETTLRWPACGRNSRKPTAWSRLCVATRPMQLGPMSVTPASPRRLGQLRLRGGPCRSRLRVVRSHHEHDGDPALATLLDHSVHLSGPQRHQRQVRGFRQLRDAAEGGQTAHGAATTVHGIDGAGEAAVDEIEEEGTAPFERVVRGADDRDGARREQRGQIGGEVTRGRRAAADAPRSPAGSRITSASAATGVASSTMRGFTSISVTAG